MTASPLTTRRTDLDWLRVIAFALLIFYHIGLFYASWDWHVNSVHASAAVEPWLQLLNPWRLLLLFFISGVATRFMADKAPSTGQVLFSRMNRLLWPLLFGVYVIVPPQAYLEAVDKIGYAEDYITFVPKYVQGFWLRCGEADCWIAPTFNHMWFVAYLMAYSALVLLAWPLLKRARVKEPSGLGLFVLFFLAPWLFLFLARLFLFPVFGSTHAFWGDWYSHATFGAAFLLGFMVAKMDSPFEAAKRARWSLLAVALASYALVQYLQSTGAAWATPGAPPPWTNVLYHAAIQAQAWAAILAGLGFARRHLRRDGPVRRYLTEAVFPYYIIHQTVIVVAGFYLTRLHIPAPLEASALIAITALACFLAYEAARRSGPLAPLFGLKARAQAKKASKPDQT